MLNNKLTTEYCSLSEEQNTLNEERDVVLLMLSYKGCRKEDLDLRLKEINS